MDAISWPRTAAMCLGKQAFSTPQLANKVQRRRSKQRRTYKVKQHVYRCKACGMFHIGTETKSRHAPTQRASHGDSADMT